MRTSWNRLFLCLCHLGQLLTYAAGLDARIAVWVAPEFLYEHAEALHRLSAVVLMQVAVGSGAHVMARHRIIRSDAERYHRVAGLPQSRQRLHRSNRGTEDEKREGSTQTGGFGLAVKSDGLLVRMQADPAVEADTSRLRLLLEGTAAVPFAGGASQWRYAALQVGLLKAVGVA